MTDIGTSYLTPGYNGLTLWVRQSGDAETISPSHIRASKQASKQDKASKMHKMTDKMAEKVAQAAARRRAREENAAEAAEIRKRSKLQSFHRVRLMAQKRTHALLEAKGEQDTAAAAAAPAAVKTEAEQAAELKTRLRELAAQTQRKRAWGRNALKKSALAERMEPMLRFWNLLSQNWPHDISAETRALLTEFFKPLRRGNKTGSRLAVAKTLDLRANTVLWRAVKLGPWFRLSEGDRLLVTLLCEMDTATRDLSLADWEALVRLDGKLTLLRQRCARMPMQAAAYALYGHAVYEVFAMPLEFIRQRRAVSEIERKRWQDEKALAEAEKQLPTGTVAYAFPPTCGTSHMKPRDWELVARFLPRISEFNNSRRDRRAVAYSHLGVIAYGGEDALLEAARPFVQQLYVARRDFRQLMTDTECYAIEWTNMYCTYLHLAVAAALEAPPFHMLCTAEDGSVVRITRFQHGIMEVLDERNTRHVLHTRSTKIKGTHLVEFLFWAIGDNTIFTTDYDQPVVRRGEQIWLDAAMPLLPTSLPGVLVDIVRDYIRGEPVFS